MEHDNEIFLRNEINGTIITTEFHGYIQTIHGDHRPIWTTSMLATNKDPFRMEHEKAEDALRIHETLVGDLSKLN